MQESWSYHNPVRIHFADRSVDRVGEIIPYRKVVLLTTPGFVKRGVVGRIQDSLGQRLSGVLDMVQPNPSIDDIDERSESVRACRPDAIMALGGGSAIDTAKALARIIAPGNDVSLSEHLREGRPFGGSGTLPIVAIPTTAGTGAEVTPFGTIWDRRSSKKCSIDGMDLFPEYAILDPLLTMGLPEEMTISTGMDAISHAFESIWNRNAGPITISNATASLRLSLGNLPKLKNDPGDIQARRSMMDASTMAGLAISHTRTALAHSLSYPLTAELDVPHGLACGFALPQILMFNMVNDDGRLARLATDLGFTDVVDLAQGLQDIMDHIGVRQLFMRKVGNFENVIGRSTLMINKKRASNNLRTAEEGDIRALLMEWASSNQIA